MSIKSQIILPLVALSVVATLSACNRREEPVKVSPTASTEPVQVSPTAPAMPAQASPTLSAATSSVKLTGSEENPPVSTSATGTSTITISADGAVTGSITTSGLQSTMAHIHQGTKGSNGPPIVTLTKSGESDWIVPADAKLTADQVATYKANGLYVNVHSDSHKDGEIRAQLSP